MLSFRLSCFIPMQIALVSNAVFAADYSTLGVADGWMNNMGLTEIPTNIPCTLVGNLDFRNNLITRIKTNSFFCLHEITTDISYNNIIYIAPGAFDQLRSLEMVRLKGNQDLPELPPHYGPNTANMKTLFIQHINPQIIPTGSYFDQMPTLQTLAIGTDLGNDFFDGWTSLRNLYFYGNIAPNFTGRTPNVERIEIKNKAMSTKNMPSENVVGLTKLKGFNIRSSDMLPLFEGAVTLETWTLHPVKSPASPIIDTLYLCRHSIQTLPTSIVTPRAVGCCLRQYLIRHWLLWFKLPYAKGLKSSKDCLYLD